MIENADQRRRDLKYWFFGAVSGIGVGGGVVGLILKHIYDKKIQKLSKNQKKTVTKTVVGADGSVTNYNSDGEAIFGRYPYGQKIGTVTEIHEEKGGITAVVQLDPAENEHPTEDADDMGIDPNDMNVEIDDLDAYSNSAEERQAYNRYFDLTEKYTGEEALKTRIISAEDYSGDYHYDKSAVNWYDVDNVFEEDLDTIDDPYMTFGVTNGKDLFAMAADRDDPDIVYVRNERQSVDFEISRIHGSYAQLVGREKPLGKADS